MAGGSGFDELSRITFSTFFNITPQYLDEVYASKYFDQEELRRALKGMPDPKSVMHSHMKNVAVVASTDAPVAIAGIAINGYVGTFGGYVGPDFRRHKLLSTMFPMVRDAANGLFDYEVDTNDEIARKVDLHLPNQLVRIESYWPDTAEHRAVAKNLGFDPEKPYFRSSNILELHMDLHPSGIYTPSTRKSA